MRTSVTLMLAAVPLAVGAALGALIPKWTDVDVDIAAGGAAFSVNGAAARPLPGAFSVENNSQTRVYVTNRDTVDRLVGVVLVPARTRIAVPAEYCSPLAVGPRWVLIVR